MLSSYQNLSLPDQLMMCRSVIFVAYNQRHGFGTTHGDERFIQFKPVGKFMDPMGKVTFKSHHHLFDMISFILQFLTKGAYHRERFSREQNGALAVDHFRGYGQPDPNRNPQRDQPETLHQNEGREIRPKEATRGVHLDPAVSRDQGHSRD